MPNNTQNINIQINANVNGLSSAAGKATAAFKTMGNAATTFTKSLSSVSSAMANIGKFSLTAPLKGFSAIGSGISKINKYFSDHNKALALSANYYKGLVGQVSNLNRFINVLGSSIRQIGQGLQNFATVFSIYVSAPIALFVKNMTSGLIEFQDRLIEVRRTTGLSIDSIDELGRAIQDISLESPTPVEDLAAMAAAWGRLGVAGVDAIAKLTTESDKLMNATDLTSSQVVDDLGKIGSFYFQTADELAESYKNIASAINELGQASPLTESEIISAALRAAPTAKQLEINLPDLLGIATTVAERAASPERAGSQLQRALTENASNLDKFAAALGTTEDEVRRMIDTNAAEFFFNVLEALQGIDSVSQRIDVANALFGGVGEKAVNALAQNLPGLYDNIVLANKAFEDGTSIQVEYERSLDSVKSQLGILQNNFRYLGFTIAEEVLPYITKFAAAAIPMARYLAEAFSNLSDKTKLLIVGIGGLIAVLGPLVLFIGSLLFSVGIITTGITALLTQVIGAASAFGRLVFAIFSLIAPFNILKLAILGIGIAFISITNTASEAGTILSGYVTKFAQWGYNLIGGFAEGIINGASIVYQAIGTVIQSFIGLIQAFSPPKEGPLRGIRDWGKNLMTTYAEGAEEGSKDVSKGFLRSVGNVVSDVNGAVKTYLPSINKTMNDVADGVADGVDTVADSITDGLKSTKEEVKDTIDEIIHIGMTFSSSFSDVLKSLSITGVNLFEDIFGEVRSVIEAVGNNLGLDRFDIDSRVLKASDAVAELIKRVQGGGGNADGALSSIYDIMGGLGDETESLINSQLRYNDAVKDLNRIKKQTQDVDEELRKEIQAISARGDLTIDEKSALIRNARLRATTRKKDLEDEKEAAEERVDTLQDEMKRNEMILKTLSSLIFPAEKEKIKKDSDDINDALSGAFDSNAANKGLDDAKDRVNALWESAESNANNFLSKIDAAGEVWRGFIAGFTGDIEGIDLDNQGAKFWDGYIPGQNIRIALEKIREQFDKVGAAVNTLWENLDKLSRFFKGGAIGGYLGLNKEDLSKFNNMEKIAYNIGYYFGQAAKEVNTLVDLLKDPALDILRNISNADKVAKERGGSGAMAYTTSFLSSIDYDKIGGDLAEGFNIVLERYFNPESEFYSDFSTIVSEFLGGIISVVVSFFAEADLTLLTTALAGILNTIIEAFSPTNLNPETLSSAVSNILQSILDGLSKVSVVDSYGNNVFKSLLTSIVDGLVSVDTSDFIDSLRELALNITEGIAAVDWVGLGSQLAKIVNNLLTALGDRALWTNIGDSLAGLITGVATALQEIDWGLTSDIFVGLVVAVKEAIIAVFSNNDAFGDFDIRLGIAIGNAIYDAIEEALGFDLSGGLRQQYNPDTNQIETYNKNTGIVQPTVQETTKGFFDWLWQQLPGDKTPGIMTIDEMGQIPNSSNTRQTYASGFSPGGGGGFDGEDDAATAGTTVAKTYVSAVNTTVQSTESISSISTAIDAMTIGAVTQSETETTKSGMKIADFTMAGVSSRFGSEATQTDLSTLITATGSWVTTNKTNIEFLGTEFGKYFTGGITEEVENVSGYLDGALSKLNAWINDSQNLTTMQNIGTILGVEMMRSLSAVISNNGANILFILEQALAGTPLGLDAISNLFPKPGEVPAASVSSLASIQPVVSTAGGNSVVIQVNNPVLRSKQDIDYMIDEVEKRFRKDYQTKR